MSTTTMLPDEQPSLQVYHVKSDAEEKAARLTIQTADQDALIVHDGWTRDAYPIHLFVDGWYSAPARTIEHAERLLVEARKSIRRGR